MWFFFVERQDQHLKYQEVGYKRIADLRVIGSELRYDAIIQFHSDRIVERAEDVEGDEAIFEMMMAQFPSLTRQEDGSWHFMDDSEIFHWRLLWYPKLDPAFSDDDVP